MKYLKEKGMNDFSDFSDFNNEKEILERFNLKLEWFFIDIFGIKSSVLIKKNIKLKIKLNYKHIAK